MSRVHHQSPSLFHFKRVSKINKPRHSPSSMRSYNSLVIHYGTLTHPKRHLSLRSSSRFYSHVFYASSAGADFTGQFVDEQAETMVMRKKKKSIAGIEQDQLVEDPTLLADPDSCFCEFRGVKIHHKICEPELIQTDGSSESQTVVKRIGVPMILLHGFGASVFSWSRVMKPLAELVGSKVLAFDRPAFGLTSRLELSGKSGSGNGDNRKKLNPYSTAFSALATLFFIDLLGANKAILVGHSAGSLVAVKSYFEAPERIAALILVAPAILAPLTSQKEVTKGHPSEGDSNQVQENSSTKSSNLESRFFQLCSALLKLVTLVLQAVAWVVKGVVDTLRLLYKKLLSAILRSALGVFLVRIIIDKFGIMAVKTSWYDSKLVTKHIVDGYTKPLRAKGWDRALIEFTAAMLADTAAESKPPLTKRLHEISCPVLIVTGDTDRLVPAWNAERLSRAIPGSCFEVIKQCGHLPHEEKPEEFISVVQKFLQKYFGDYGVTTV